MDEYLRKKYYNPELGLSTVQKLYNIVKNDKEHNYTLNM